MDAKKLKKVLNYLRSGRYVVVDGVTLYPKCCSSVFKEYVCDICSMTDGCTDDVEQICNALNLDHSRTYYLTGNPLE